MGTTLQQMGIGCSDLSSREENAHNRMDNPKNKSLSSHHEEGNSLSVSVLNHVQNKGHRVTSALGID